MTTTSLEKPGVQLKDMECAIAVIVSDFTKKKLAINDKNYIFNCTLF